MSSLFMDGREKIETIYRELAAEHKFEFALWLKNFAEGLMEEICHSNSDAVIGAIQEDLRQMLPVEAVLSSEEILQSKRGPNADCDPQTTVHVDSFLYDDDVIDELCEEGKMSRNYCSRCGCKQVLPLNFISHSSSKMQLKFIFQYLVPDLRDKLILDIGSRTGAVLYAAHLYGGAERVVGVELNGEFCQVQQAVVDKYHMGEQIKVIHSDICHQTELVQHAEVIVMNNVFEFFAPLDVQERVWQFLRSVITRPGVMLVTSPSLEQSLANLQTGITLTTWVEKLDCTSMRLRAKRVLEIEEEDMMEIHCYRVLPHAHSASTVPIVPHTHSGLEAS